MMINKKLYLGLRLVIVRYRFMRH